jgi:hypothetical protein
MKRNIILQLILPLVLLSGFQAVSQPALPVVAVRFANPHFDCPTKNYCVDVEFLANTPGQQLFGMNVRFFYDDNVLEYLSMGDFEVGYGSPVPPQIVTGPAGSGDAFGIAGPLEWFNGTVQLLSPSPVYISTTQWTKLFNVCFHVDDPHSLDIENFCPTIVWDLQENPPELGGGFLPGDDGVVMTVVAPFPLESAPTTENVVQFNWQYDPSGNLIGFPVSEVCVSTTCGYIIPLSNWSLVLGIGLMLVASVFFYRRRLNS